MPKCCVLRRVLTFGDPMVYSPPDSSVHGISQARILECLPFPSPGNLPDPGIEPKSLTLQTDSLPSEPPVKPIKVKWALKVEHWSSRFSVFMKRNTREFTLCLFVFSSISLPHTPPFGRSHREASLGRNSSYQNLTLLAPSTGTSIPPELWGKKFLLFIPLSLLYYFIAFLADKYKIIYFGNLKKKMNERKLKKLLHSLGIFEIPQNWSFLRFQHLMNWRLLWPREGVIAAFMFEG